MSGRLILVKHVLSSIPVHILVVTKVTDGVIKQIERLLCDFLWGVCEGKHKFHWVKWSTCAASLCEMGLGIRKLQDIHLLFNIKSCWKLLLKESLWSKYCNAKYRVAVEGWHSNSSFASNRWRKLMEVMPWVISNSLWLINRGNSSFWMDKWWSEGILFNMHRFSKGTDLSVSIRDVFFHTDLFVQDTRRTSLAAVVCGLI